MLVFGTPEGLAALASISQKLNFTNEFIDRLEADIKESDFRFGLNEEFFEQIRKLNNMKTDISVIYNLNSLLEGFPRLVALNPYWNSCNQVFNNELEFDQMYVNHITSNQSAFKEIMDIMRNVYNGKHVFILCDWSNEINVNIIEAIIKFITDTYGYRCNIVNSPEDFCVVEGTFSTSGIQMFDKNLETYVQLFGTRGLESNE